MRHGLILLAPIAVMAAGLFVACGNNSSRSGFDDNAGDAGFEGSTGLGDPTPCAGLECKVAQCGTKEGTTLTGKVYDPAGANPLPNVVVYIPKGIDPDGPLAPFPDSTETGVTCDKCADVKINPLTSTITDAEGNFTLEGVPVDSDVPVIVQIGKWRRKAHVDITTKCEENKAPDREVRLPKNSTEGDLPQIAVTTGGADALECLLRGIGIDDNEFTQGHGGQGHIHLFKGSGGKMGTDAETEFWNSDVEMKKYDIALLSCEGTPTIANKGGDAAGARAAILDYMNVGGRVFSTHYHYVWFQNSPDDAVKALANWGTGPTGGGSVTEYDVNMSFGKGEQLATWLKAVNASTTVGKVKLANLTNSVSDVTGGLTSWIAPEGDATRSKYMSFNMPLNVPEEEQCGRAVFSDLHISGSSGPSSISGCSVSAGGLSPQQKALEFLFFDLSACIQPKGDIPPVPR